MNLITAWIVVCQKTEDETKVILAQQRIEEIRGATRFKDILCCCITKNKNVIPSKPLCITSVKDKKSISWSKYPWFRIKSWLDDDHKLTLSIIKELDTSNNESLENDYLPLVTFELAPLTEKMLKEKQAKQSELFETIKKTQNETSKKLKQLLANKEESDYQSCLKSIPDGYTFKYIVCEAPSGTLKIIQNEKDVDESNI